MPQKPPPIPCEQRLLLYADILGWSRLVHDSENDATKKSLVEYVIHKFRQELAFNRLPGVATATGWQFSLASDSFFASSPASAEYFSELLTALSGLAHSLLRRGIYLRGSLVAGSLFHDQEVVVGPAVVSAVELEKSTCHPRIVVHESVFQYRDEEEHWVYRSEDGVPAFDYIRFLYAQMDNPGDALGRDVSISRTVLTALLGRTSSTTTRSQRRTPEAPVPSSLRVDGRYLRGGNQQHPRSSCLPSRRFAHGRAAGAAPARALHDGRRRGRLSQLPQVNGARLVRGAKLDVDELRELL